MFSIHLNVQEGLLSCLGTNDVHDKRASNSNKNVAIFSDIKKMYREMRTSRFREVYEFHRARFRLPISWWNGPNNMPQLILIYTVSL